MVPQYLIIFLVELPVGWFLQDLEKQESEFQSSSNAIHSKLQTEINELKEKIATGCDSTSLWDGLNNPLSDSAEQLNSARKVVFVDRGQFATLSLDL